MALDHFVVLNGKHWHEIAPETFKKHHVEGFSHVLCEKFDPSGPLIEITRGDVILYIPHSSVVMVVHVPDEKTAAGFGITSVEKS